MNQARSGHGCGHYVDPNGDIVSIVNYNLLDVKDDWVTIPTSDLKAMRLYLLLLRWW